VVLEQQLQLLVRAAVSLDVADVLQGCFFLRFRLRHLASVLSLVNWSVVFFLEDAVLAHVLEALVHPSTCATYVLLIAIDQLLH